MAKGFQGEFFIGEREYHWFWYCLILTNTEGSDFLEGHTMVSALDLLLVMHWILESYTVNVQ